MKYKTILTIFFLFGLILVMGLASSTELFKQGITNNFAKPCVYNGTWCSSLATCNLTIVNNNGTILMDNQLMSNHISYHNITLPNLDLGNYKANMVCIDNGYGGTNTWDILITPTGDSRGVGFVLILAISSMLLIIFAVATKNSILGFISGILFIITGVYVMIFGFLNLADLYTRVTALISLGLGVIFMIVSFIELIQGANDAPDFD